MSTSLTIRNLDKEVETLLRLRAATHGRAMEAEAREILTRAVMEPRSPLESNPRVNDALPSVCTPVRGIWKGKVTTEEVLSLTRED
jgi:plasmid stability protein